MAPGLRSILPPAWGHLALQVGLRLLYQTPCMQCGAPQGDPLCPACLDACRSLPSRRCSRCQGSLEREGGCPLCDPSPPPVSAVTVLGPYTGGLRQAIRAMKYQGRADIGLVLGRELASLLVPWQGRPLRVLPVPIHPERRAERGYNQAEPLAWQVARRCGWDYDPHAIRRRAPSTPSYRQGRLERWSEARSAFQAVPHRLAGCSVLVVDDILTSGATLWAIAHALRSAGAREVRAAVLARAAMRRGGS